MEKVTPHECLRRAASYLPDDLAGAAAYIETLFEAYGMSFESQRALVLAIKGVVDAARASQFNESKEIPVNLYHKKGSLTEASTLLHIQVGINVMRPYLKLFLYNRKSRLYKMLEQQGFLEELFEINAPARLGEEN